jgi:hypothetical protein
MNACKRLLTFDLTLPTLKVQLKKKVTEWRDDSRKSEKGRVLKDWVDGF